MDAKELARLNVKKLREEATKISNVAGVGGMKREALVELVAKHHNLAVGQRTDSEKKSAVKARIRILKAKRDEAIAQKDHKTVATLRRGIRSLKRRTRDLARAIKSAPAPATTASQEGTPAAS
ncbi:MAG: hypothetical protein AB7G75_15810 [Candidatus Binatia bacterium]